jgi:hypothetical protein
MLVKFTIFIWKSIHFHLILQKNCKEKATVILIYGMYLIVLLQVGLDGIRMLDPSTSRTLRIYPLDSLTRYEVGWSAFFMVLLCMHFLQRR